MVTRAGRAHHVRSSAVATCYSLGVHRLLAGLGVLASSLALTPVLAAPSGATFGPAPTVGDVAPPVEGARVSGEDPVHLRGLAGRVVLLDFWATWCGPCRSVMPELDALHRRFHPAGLTVLGLSAEGRSVVERHLRRFPVGYTVAGDARESLLRYRVRGIPTLYLVDRAGRVRFASEGVDGAVLRQVEALVPRLLAEPAPRP